MGDNYEMTQAEIAAALNEWQRRYIDEPERFQREFQTVAEFLAQEANGDVPSYGTEGAAYLLKIHGELTA